MTKKLRGFAIMDPEKQRKVASKGGKASHALGKAHEWTKEQAREAGRKGGIAFHRNHGRKKKNEGNVENTEGER